MYFGGKISMGIIGTLANKTLNSTEVVYMDVTETLPLIHSIKTYADTSVKITEIIQPIHASLAGFKIIAGYCLPPHKKYIIECLSLGAQG